MRTGKNTKTIRDARPSRAGKIRQSRDVCAAIAKICDANGMLIPSNRHIRGTRTNPVAQTSRDPPFAGNAFFRSRLSSLTDYKKRDGSD